jgi:hypothetical protein
MVVAKVVVASMRACKVMTTDRVCDPESQPRSLMHHASSKLRTLRPVAAKVPEGAQLARQGIQFMLHYCSHQQPKAVRLA